MLFESLSNPNRWARTEYNGNVWTARYAGNQVSY